MFEMKNVACWVKLHSFLNLWQCGVFSVTKVCLFLPMVFIESCLPCFSSRQYMSLTFVKQCWYEENTPCQGMIWIFPSKMLYFYTGLLMVLHKLTCEPWNAQKKLSRALPLSSSRGLRAPDPASQGSKKTTSLPALFCCTYFPRCVLYWHCLLTV